MGAAALFGGETLGHPLPPQASSFTAELWAIAIALERIGEQRETNYVIYTDSRSAVQSLQAVYTRNPLVLKIQQHIISMHTRKRITLCWVPSHVGIEGNEAADRAAGEAARGGRRCRTPRYLYSNALPSGDYLPYIEREFRRRWQEEWGASANGADLRKIKPQLGRWQSAHQTGRRREIIMARLRLGHTRYTHGPLMAGDGRLLQCDRCGVSCTLNHILLECGRFRAQREIGRAHV